MEIVKSLLSQCRWPDLPLPYAPALRDAAAFILARFEVLGIIVAGSVLRGEGGPFSDLDIYVIRAKSQRQRIQKRFRGVPAEIFVNPPRAIEGYFVDEVNRGRPCTAHMLATGFVVLDCDPVVEQLRAQARTVLASTPDADPMKLVLLRYLAADRYENALDIVPTDPAGANAILNLAVVDMLHFAFWKANRFLPRDKDLLKVLATLNPDLAEPVARFFTTAEIAERLALAEKIADQTIETRGFFEWESVLEDV